MVEGSVIVELKSVEKLVKVHSKQVLTQLRLSGQRLGLLINFGEIHLKDGIERIVNVLPEDRHPSFARARLVSYQLSVSPLNSSEPFAAFAFFA